MLDEIWMLQFAPQGRRTNDESLAFVAAWFAVSTVPHAPHKGLGRLL
jgi:hypothetical protein